MRGGVEDRHLADRAVGPNHDFHVDGAGETPAAGCRRVLKGLLNPLPEPGEVRTVLGGGTARPRAGNCQGETLVPVLSGSTSAPFPAAASARLLSEARDASLERAGGLNPLRASRSATVSPHLLSVLDCDGVGCRERPRRGRRPLRLRWYRGWCRQHRRLAW